MADWRAPPPVRECTLALGTPGKYYRDIPPVAAPGRNLRNSPFRNYIRVATGNIQGASIISVMVLIMVMIAIMVSISIVVIAVTPVPVPFLIFLRQMAIIAVRVHMVL